MDPISFGRLPDGREVTLYTIRNSCGEYAEILDHGASVHSLFVRDAAGALHDVVLGAASAENLCGGTLEAIVIGRVANRIAKGRFSIDGRSFQLEQNRGEHFIHGGSDNYAHQLFTLTEHTENQITLHLHDPGSCGFGCSAFLDVTYTMGEDHSLSISYRMWADGDTLFCPTNHAYFNLSDLGDAREHKLQIFAHSIAAKDPDGIPQGEVLPVSGTAWDFSSPRRIRENMALAPAPFRGFDDFFLPPGEGTRHVATLSSPMTGLSMEVHTDMPCLVLFTPGFCAKMPGKNGTAYPDYAAVCLETQFVPNAVNCASFSSPIFRKGEVLTSTTKYLFRECGHETL